MSQAKRSPRPSKWRLATRRSRVSRGVLMRVAIALVAAGALSAALVLRSDGHSSSGVAIGIVAPLTGATVASPVTLDVSARGAKIGTPSEGLDHLHISLDGGLPIADYNSTQPVLPIPPGEHTLTVELAGPDHAPLLPARSVSFTVAG